MSDRDLRDALERTQRELRETQEKLKVSETKLALRDGDENGRIAELESQRATLQRLLQERPVVTVATDPEDPESGVAAPVLMLSVFMSLSAFFLAFQTRNHRTDDWILGAGFWFLAPWFVRVPQWVWPRIREVAQRWLEPVLAVLWGILTAVFCLTLPRETEYVAAFFPCSRRCGGRPCSFPGCRNPNAFCACHGLPENTKGLHRSGSLGLIPADNGFPLSRE